MKSLSDVQQLVSEKAQTTPQIQATTDHENLHFFWFRIQLQRLMQDHNHDLDKTIDATIESSHLNKAHPIKQTLRYVANFHHESAVCVFLAQQGSLLCVVYQTLYEAQQGIGLTNLKRAKTEIKAIQAVLSHVTNQLLRVVFGLSAAEKQAALPFIDMIRTLFDFISQSEPMYGKTGFIKNKALGFIKETTGKTLDELRLEAFCTSVLFDEHCGTGQGVSPHRMQHIVTTSIKAVKSLPASLTHNKFRAVNTAIGALTLPPLPAPPPHHIADASTPSPPIVEQLESETKEEEGFPLDAEIAKVEEAKSPQGVPAWVRLSLLVAGGASLVPLILVMAHILSLSAAVAFPFTILAPFCIAAWSYTGKGGLEEAHKAKHLPGGKLGSVAPGSAVKAKSLEKPEKKEPLRISSVPDQVQEAPPRPDRGPAGEGAKRAEAQGMET